MRTLRLRRGFRTTLLALSVMSIWISGTGPALAAGRFTDDDGSVHEGYIEAVATEGITVGCNPPTNTLFCPDDPVTRGQMAAFLVRAFDYTDTGGGDLFDDDDASAFEADIDRLATAGVTVGCNPPANTRFCPDDVVTRGQMAAFLVRAFDYTDTGGGDLFDDDDASAFESEIDRLATAGVTVGCNPPANTRFCPDDVVTRGQMASFLGRALGLTPTPPGGLGGYWTCTEVVGFSQTNQWYTGGEGNQAGSPFESIVGDASWQLRWLEGAEARIIANEAWPAWDASPVSACTSGPVDRVILTISGSRGTDVAGWAIDIRDAVERVRIEIPTVERILLQPVVGGPAGETCISGGEQVRADLQHPYILDAIVQVASESSDVFTGMAPRVDACSDFSDGRGHLTEDAAERMGAKIGDFYA